MAIKELRVISKPFDDSADSRKVSIIGYHWSKRKFKSADDLGTKSFYFCDDPKTWASDWIKNNKLYQVKIVLSKPYVDLKSNKPFETPELSTLIKSLKAQGYDGMIYTPNQAIKSKSSRQGLAFYPKQQVKNLKCIRTT